MDILVLYSEYSRRCKRFMERLESDPIIDANKFGKMCIDCPSVRRAIADQDMLVVRMVPAVIVKPTANAPADVYEGKEATQWLETFSAQLYEQLSSQQEEAARLERQRQIEFDERVKAEAEAAVEKRMRALEAERKKAAASNRDREGGGNTSPSVKQQARMIEQDRREAIVFSEDTLSGGGSVDDAGSGSTSTTPSSASPQPPHHVTQIKSEGSNSTRVSDLVKNMEREREIEMANIRKTMPPPTL